MIRMIKLFMVMALLAMGTGCGDNDSSSRALATIDVTPANSSIAAGTSQQFIATGTYSDNTTQDLTATVTWSSSDASRAMISNAADSCGKATAMAAGSTTIMAASDHIVGSATLTVTTATLQSIAITPANAGIAKGTWQQFAATGTYSDNSTQDLTSAVTWGSSSTSVATIDSTGRASALAAGGTTITAVLGPISGSTTLTVTAATLQSIAITPANAGIAKGTWQQFVATGTYSDNSTQDLTSAVTWGSSSTSVATIDATGRASALAAGNTSITAVSGLISGSTTLTVTGATLSSIAITPVNPSIAMGAQQQFAATGTFSDASTQDLTALVTWSSSDVSKASISNAAGTKGMATALAIGSTTIRAISGLISGSTRLTVTSTTLSSISITPVNPSIAKGMWQQFIAMGTYADHSTQDLTTLVTWGSSDVSKASISNAAGTKGMATALAAGSTTITAVSGLISGSTTLTVTAATLSSIAITPVNPSIAKGAQQQLIARGNFSDASTQDLTALVTWGSSDVSKASISNAAGTKGLATALAAGSTTITAVLGLVSGSTTLTVTAATLSSIAITPANPTIAKGTQQQFIATGTFSDASTQDLTASVTWSSSDVSKASISNAAGTKGMATALAAGSTTITAVSGLISGSTTLTVTAVTLSSIAITPANPTIARGTQQQFIATGTYSDASTQDLTVLVTWSSSNFSRASISNAVGTKGMATALANGITTITASSGLVSGSTSLTVTDATLSSIAITPVNPTIARGTQQQFVATGTYSDASTQDLTALATWSSSDVSRATISNAAGTRGRADAIAAGSVTITAILGTVSGTTLLTITDVPLVSITVTPSDASVDVGDTFQFAATGTYADASTQNLTSLVNWTSSNPLVASISNGAGTKGRASGVSVGSVTITATLGSLHDTADLEVEP